MKLEKLNSMPVDVCKNILFLAIISPLALLLLLSYPPPLLSSSSCSKSLLPILIYLSHGNGVIYYGKVLKMYW